MLRKDLLRVSRAGGGYHPQFAGRGERPLAARVVGVFQGHVGEPRHRLDDALDDLEREADDFKLVRGFAALLEREAVFETRAPLPPERVRRVVFESAESAGGVVDGEDRRAALESAADRLGTGVEAIERSLYADRDVNEVLSEFDPRWGPDELVEQYNLSLAQTALFDATEVRIRSSDPKRLVSAVKRLGLLYEIERRGDGVGGTTAADRDDDGGADGPSGEERILVVTGPDALFRRTRRYGTAFARLLRSVAATAEWSLSATIDDRGTDRELRLGPDDVSVPDVEPVTEPTYDSGVEADFAARFGNLDLDWELSREPEPLAAGARAMIPDFAFDYRPAGSREVGDRDGEAGTTVAPAFRVYFEVMGFWTPEYVEKKLDQFGSVDDDVELLVAVDDSLGVGEEIESLDHRVVTYSGRVRVKDVVDALGEYEADLVEAAAASLPSELAPDADVIDLDELAAERGVGVDALGSVTFPEHERVGGTLVRPAVLDAVGAEIDVGMSLSDVEGVLDEHGLDDASAVLSRLGYRVAWEGLSGGTVEEK
ncbi:DUF790 family protein [Halobellus limi]|uniref:DUF790 family protein n=1 Tax=Halobellus limi TaxID=699433 RepID=A0A1H5T6F0_9EURY|nr:DUF790 family protein [Halobellus limi]QCC47405.1 DUF790 family protein [Halobellus limi]SEF57738.1 hypothetical protein SAMN04488133_0173 [Halobellus limi]